MTLPTNLNATYREMISRARQDYEVEMKPFRTALEEARVKAARRERRKIADAMQWLVANEPNSLPRHRGTLPFRPPTSSSVDVCSKYTDLSSRAHAFGDPEPGRSALDRMRSSSPMAADA